MSMPNMTKIEIPLLKAIFKLGGSGRPKNIYPLVTEQFPELTQQELVQKVESGNNKWENRIQWTRQKLIDKGELKSPQRGIWEITEKGINRLDGKSSKNPDFYTTNLVELYDEYEEDFKSQLLDSLHELTPIQFEEFSKRLLQVYGFVELHVTSVGPDGGIDGYGQLKVGLATMNVAFQCKRWQNKISSTMIQQFRGAIQGEYQQGIFFTTSDFTKNATKLSIKKGAVPIVLMNGNSIIDIMTEKGLGVSRKPVYLYYESVNDFLNDHR